MMSARTSYQKEFSPFSYKHVKTGLNKKDMLQYLKRNYSGPRK